MPEEEKEKTWLFTWGYGQAFPNRYIKIKGTQDSARQEMFRLFHNRWGMQYPEEDEAKLNANHVFELQWNQYAP